MRDFHRTAFDEGTKVKLGMFGDYTREWLPVWLSQADPRKPITIVDFFAGPGADCEGTPGSPLIILKQLRQSGDLIRQKGARVRLILNEVVKAKAESLRVTMEAQKVPSSVCTWKVQDLTFEDAFAEVYSDLGVGPNLLILDQQGMKEISDDVFRRILKLPRTDFILFIASSSIRRFETHPHFQRHLKIPRGTVTSSTFNETHRAVTKYFRDLATAGGGADYFLGGFSIKKGSNIYGLIFGSGHPLGLHKFLRVCWRTDSERGEANFDIDDDRLTPDTPHLFQEMDQPKKLTLFDRVTKTRILSGELVTDRDIYIHSLQEGVLPSRGKAVVRELLKAGTVRVVGGGQPRVSIEGYKEPRTLEVMSHG